MARTVMWVGFGLRLSIAVWNGFFGPSPGAESDAAHFHDIAVDFARTLSVNTFEISWVYAYALGIVYRLTVESIFLGSVLSCVAWLMSAHILLKTMRLLSFRRKQRVAAMLVFALMPSSILWTSVTLREPYQLLMVNMAIYAALKIHLHKSSKHWIWLLAAVGIGGMLHGALLGFGMFLIVATAIWILMRQRPLRRLATLIILIPFVASVLFYLFAVFYSGINHAYGLDKGLGAAVEFYQRAGLTTDARTAYKDDVTINGTAGLLTFVPISLLQYLFEPTPSHISQPVDVMLAMENVVRAFLIWKAVVAVLRLRGHQRRSALLVFSSYLVLETIWGIGTVNWGTAARHHISSGGLLAMSGFSRARRPVERRGQSAAPMGDALPAVS